MSDPEKQELPDGAKVLAIIMLSDNVTVTVQGSVIGDVGECYKMLGLARDAVFVNAMNAKAQAEGARLQAEAQAQAIRRQIDEQNGRPRIVQ